MLTADFNYQLPKKLIAQKPVRSRDHSRLMVVNRKSKKITLDHFFNLPKYLKRGDVLVFNNTKVIPARLFGKRKTGGKIEILLLKEISKGIWECLISGHRRKVGIEIRFSKNLKGEIVERQKEGIWLIKFNISGKEFEKNLQKIGQTPTPPYIKKISPLPGYQTIFAKYSGSVAAPTAGFHFSKKLFKKLKQKGIQIEFITLHIGLGTFAPIREKDIENHQMHTEEIEIKKSVAKRLNKAKKAGRRIIAVGTTSCRVLETAADQKGYLKPFQGETSIYIYPGYKFKFTDALITNFHLPKSTLLLLVSAFAGRDLIFQSYRRAIKEEFRFYSFGDGMLIV